jgi:hypothetical protein
MNKAEKGYFKKYASMHTIGEKNNYVKLFDVIEKQAERSSEYNEAYVKKQFDAKFNRQLPVVKNYLYGVILESLQLFHDVKDPIRRVQALIAQSDILTGKNLSKQAEEVLKKAKKIAEEREMLAELLAILARERILSRGLADPVEYEKAYTKIFEDELDVIEKIQNTAEFNNLRSKLIKFTSVTGTGFVRSDEHKHELDELVSHPLLQPGGRTLTRHTKFLANEYRANLYLSLEDYQKAYQNQVKMLEIMEKEVGRLFSVQRLQALIFNVMVVQIRLKLHDECAAALEKVKNFEKYYKCTLSEYEKIMQLYTIAAIEIPLRMDMGDKDGGLKAIEYIAKPLKAYEAKIVPSWRVTVYYFIAGFYFMIEDFQNSGKWLSKILQFATSDFSADYQCYARLMNLIVHYELKNYDHIEYAMKSAYYFMRKRNRIYKYEQTIIKYMKRSLRARNEKELVNLFTEMKFDLEMLYKDNYEKNAFDAFNIIPWLDSKIEKVSIIEAVKRIKEKEAV